ncbi:10948_t:CDS:2, partial [Racocetra fulgida]
LANGLFVLKIRDKIEQELKEQSTGIGIVKIKFPVKELDDLNLREKIHNAFNAERIGFELFIKDNSGEKEMIHTKLRNSLENQNRNWCTINNTICVVGNRDFRPDVGVWFQRPTLPQRRMSIIYTCPHPNVWIEQNTTGIEFVAIALPTGLNPFHANPNTGISTTHATSQ